MDDGSNTIKSFRDLRVWRSAFDLTIQIYKLTSSFPQHETYGLKSQMQRASVSVCSNIAEGFGRRSLREKDQFYSMANGSLTELENQIYIAKAVGYFNDKDTKQLIDMSTTTHKMLITLQKVNKTKGESR